MEQAHVQALQHAYSWNSPCHYHSHTHPISHSQSHSHFIFIESLMPNPKSWYHILLLHPRKLRNYLEQREVPVRHRSCKILDHDGGSELLTVRLASGGFRFSASCLISLSNDRPC